MKNASRSGGRTMRASVRHVTNRRDPHAATRSADQALLRAALGLPPTTDEDDRTAPPTEEEP